MTNNLVRLAISIVISQLAGIPGAVLTNPTRNSWYRRLDKPSFNPPAWVFPVVWTALYTLMGTSLFLVWNKGPERQSVKSALVPFSIQWLLNSAWSLVFFKGKAPLVGLINILMLWVSILATIFKFSQVSRLAGLLLVPYALWVSFAGLLNFEIWRRN